MRLRWISADDGIVGSLDRGEFPFIAPGGRWPVCPGG
jgi:hypothetical protein